MIPIDQTRLYDPTDQTPPGNCWTACLASILEKPLLELPDEAEFWSPGKKPIETWPAYEKKTYEFLATLGLSYVELTVPDEVLALIGDVYCVIVGPSPRDRSIRHAVVGRGREIVHDPHPARTGLAGGSRDWQYGYLIRTFV